MPAFFVSIYSKKKQPKQPTFWFFVQLGRGTKGVLTKRLNVLVLFNFLLKIIQ